MRRNLLYCLAFAALALSLSSCGVYYTTSYSTSPRVDGIYYRPTTASRLAVVESTVPQYNNYQTEAPAETYFETDPETGRIYLADGVSYEELLRKFDSPTYNVTINYGGWYDPWYNPWWGSWRYRHHYYSPYYRGYWYSSWYDPWYYDSWYTWSRGYYYGGWYSAYSWYDPWYWGSPYYHHYYYHPHHHHHHHHHGADEHDADEVFGNIGLETAQRYEQDEIRGMLEKLSDEEEYGKVLRAKGILQNAAGGWFQFDYVPGEIDIREGSADYTGRLCVIGADLDEKALMELFHL
jgi:Putative GTPases (G3E family)